jgi:hypothetical protein
MLRPGQEINGMVTKLKQLVKMCGASDAAQATKKCSGGSYGTAMEKSIPLRASKSQPSSTATHQILDRKPASVVHMKDCTV